MILLTVWIAKQSNFFSRVSSDIIEDSQQNDETKMLLRFRHEGVDRSGLHCEEGDYTEIRKCAADEEEACQQQCEMETSC